MSFFSWRNWSWENQCICATEGSRSKTSLGTGVKILTSRPAFNFWLSGSLWTYLLYFLLMLKLLSPCFTHAAYTATQMHTHTLFPLCLPSALYPSHIYPQCCELGRISHYSCSTIFFSRCDPLVSLWVWRSWKEPWNYNESVMLVTISPDGCAG